nr:notchless protein homolog [Ipomoea trifida]
MKCRRDFHSSRLQQAVVQSPVDILNLQQKMSEAMDVEAPVPLLRDSTSSVMCRLTDPEGTPLGTSMYLPEIAGPKELNQMVNKLLNNDEKLPYAFYISDQELVVHLGSYLEKNKVSVEKVLTIVYQPQAVFRIRPVTRCSATIAGHTEAVLSVAFSPDGQQLASGSGDTTVIKNWVLCIAWSPDGKYLVSGSKTGELICWDPQTGNPLGNPLTGLDLQQGVHLFGPQEMETGISWEPVHLSAPCRRFVSASKDGDARIWDATLRKCVICLSGHTLAITCVKWGGDGVIYTGSQDCTIKVWETSQGKLIRELKELVTNYGILGKSHKHKQRDAVGEEPQDAVGEELKPEEQEPIIPFQQAGVQAIHVRQAIILVD